ncbi:T9SS type A sorting domain-containing protein, partial [candidate division KSB1 bacterium]|nr:T9SS type A sorting domain-containing protein [candidate division KSB1 bacterium]
NPETTIKYQLPEAAIVNLTIFNLKGQQIRTLVNEDAAAGYHSIVWDGKDHAGTAVASGVYIYRISAGEFVEVKKMALIR